MAHVAAAAVACAADGESEALGDNDAFAVKLLMSIVTGFEAVDDVDESDQLFDLEADRPAAAALPCLLLPGLERAVVTAGYTRADIAAAALAVARNAPLETRLYLTRGSDRIWPAPCAEVPCLHQVVLEWLIESARRAQIGPWDPETRTRPLIAIEGDLASGLSQLNGDAIDTLKLEAAIRGVGAAAASGCCVATEAAAYLTALIDAQRRGMLRQDELGYSVDRHGDESLVAARALLDAYATSATAGPLLAHLTALRSSASLLSGFLHAIVGAGAETPRRALAARAIWPDLLRHGLSFAATSPNPYADSNWGDWALGALLPQPLAWSGIPHIEIETEPIDWTNPTDLLDLVPAWVFLASGNRHCLDDLISFLRRLIASEQVRHGLPWVSDMCIDDGHVLLHRSASLTSWLIDLRPHVESFGRHQRWQQLVDALVAAGNNRLATYSV